MNRIAPLVIIVLAIAAFFGYIRPTWDGDIAATRQQITDYNNALDAAARFKEKEAALEAERDKLPPDQLARLDAFLPDSVDNIQLILDLNALASRSGLTLSNFTTSNVPNANSGPGSANPTPEGGDGAIGAQANPVDSLTISFTGQGTYNAFRTFLAGIEQSLRPLDLSTLVVANSDTGVYSYQITLKFYWLH